MEQPKYFVEVHEGQWKIRHDEKHFGPFGTPDDAIWEAVQRAHRTGRAAQVLVQGPRRTYSTRWTCGQDPYPPPGYFG